MIKALLAHSRWHLSHDLAPKIRELTASWCSISRTVWTNALVDHGGFLLRAVMNSSCSSLHFPTVHYTGSRWLFSAIWMCSHSVACCIVFLLLPVLRTISEFASCVRLTVAALARLRCTNSCLRCCCVQASDALDDAPIDRLDSNPLSPAWYVCAAMICWPGIGEKDDNKKKWEVLRNI